MAVQPPVGEPGEPSNRWPWIALALGLLVIAVAVAFFLFNRQRTVNITVESTPTVAAAARAGAASPGPPTLVSPTVLPSGTLAPTGTPVATATAIPVPTKPVAPTQPPVPPPTEPAAPPPTQLPAVQAAPPPPTQPAQAAAPTLPAQPAAQPTQPPAPTQATAQPAPPPAAPLSPTPFVGQVANLGGAGNTRADFDAAYGPPVGETADHLVVYRRNNLEYHVNFVPDPSGRAAVLVEMPQPQTNASPFTIESAMAEAHKLLPKDAQPPNPQPEGSDQFVVERYTSQLLGQALPANVFTANKGQPGQFLLVYVRDSAQQSRITRFIVGPGTDPQALINQGR
jgi:hypothetical protein